VPISGVISAPDASSIYEVPLVLHREGLDNELAGHLRIEGVPNLTEWEALVESIHAATEPVTIAVVGKYVTLRDAYLSVMEALYHGGFHHGSDVQIRWVASDDLGGQATEDALRDVHGVLIPGGFGIRGVEGKIAAVRYARERGVPFLGICLGLQCAVIEFARNVLGLADAHTLEYTLATPHPVIHLLPSQHDVSDKGGTMRLGAYECRLAAGSLAQRLYDSEGVSERHRHRYEVNNAYRERFRLAGFKASGVHPGLDVVEIMELEGHPFFVGVQFHPEFRSSPLKPHPIFRGFVAAALGSRTRAGKSDLVPLESEA
jgi:CTP synthase